MKRFLLSIISMVTIMGLIVPSVSLARDRQDRDRESTNTSDTGSTVTVQNSVVISSHSGDNDSDDDTNIETGEEGSYVHVETTVNGETVETTVSSSDEDGGVSSRRSDRSHIYEDRDRGIHVETEIDQDVIIEEENDSGNQTNNGEDGQPGADGANGQPGDDVDNDEEEVVEDGTDGEDGDDDRRRGRTERDLGHRGGVAMLTESGAWERFTNYFKHVFSLFFV